MKLFISATECTTKDIGFNQCIDLNCKYYLYSYYNLRGRTNKVDYLSVKGEVFIDSGAHTLQKPGKEVDYEKFVFEYIKFINEYKRYIDYIVELDVENKIGMSLVEKYRDQIYKETGIEPIVVWHRERGFDYLKYMTKKYKYIGFSGFVEDKTGENEVPIKYIDTFIKMAHDNGALVHGFGYTRSDLYRHKFDSVDSSSWGMFRRFGKIDKFEVNRMKQYKSLRNFKNIYKNMADYNVKEWIKYQQFLDILT